MHSATIRYNIFINMHITQFLIGNELLGQFVGNFTIVWLFS